MKKENETRPISIDNQLKHIFDETESKISAAIEPIVTVEGLLYNYPHLEIAINKYISAEYFDGKFTAKDKLEVFCNIVKNIGEIAGKNQGKVTLLTMTIDGNFNFDVKKMENGDIVLKDMTGKLKEEYIFNKKGENYSINPKQEYKIYEIIDQFDVMQRDSFGATEKWFSMRANLYNDKLLTELMNLKTANDKDFYAQIEKDGIIIKCATEKWFSMRANLYNDKLLTEEKTIEDNLDEITNNTAEAEYHKAESRLNYILDGKLYKMLQDINKYSHEYSTAEQSELFNRFVDRWGCEWAKGTTSEEIAANEQKLQNYIGDYKKIEYEIQIEIECLKNIIKGRKAQTNTAIIADQEPIVRVGGFGDDKFLSIDINKFYKYEDENGELKNRGKYETFAEIVKQIGKVADANQGTVTLSMPNKFLTHDTFFVEKNGDNIILKQKGGSHYTFHKKVDKNNKITYSTEESLRHKMDVLIERFDILYRNNNEESFMGTAKLHNDKLLSDLTTLNAASTNKSLFIGTISKDSITIKNETTNEIIKKIYKNNIEENLREIAKAEEDFKKLLESVANPTIKKIKR